MASDFYIGIRIGAAALDGVGKALAGAQATMDDLGRVADALRAKHDRLGETMARAVVHPLRNVGELRAQYEQLGRTIDQVRTREAALGARIARGEALSAQRGEYGKRFAKLHSGTSTIATPIIGAVTRAANFESALRDVAIDGGLSRADEQKLGDAVRAAVRSTGAKHGAVLEGVSELIGSGMSAKDAGRQTRLLGQIAIASGADMKDVAGMSYALTETLGIKGDAALKDAFSRATYGGKLGHVKFADIAKAMPDLASSFAAPGVTGQAALSQIVASLAVGREGAASGDDAAGNLRAWLARMTSGSTAKAYEKAGVDYRKSMSNIVGAGYSEYEASLEIARKFIASHGDGFAAEWKRAGARGDAGAQRKLMEQFGMREVFQDPRAIDHLLSMRGNWDKYQATKQAIGGKQAAGALDEDHARRAETASAAWGKLQAQIDDLGVTVGDTLLPPLTDVMNTLSPMVEQVNAFAVAHPNAIRGIVGFAAATVAMRGATLGAGLALNVLVKTPLNALGAVLSTVSAKWTLLRALTRGGARLSTLFQLGGMNAGAADKLAAGLGRVRTIVLGVGRSMLAAVGRVFGFVRGLGAGALGSLMQFARIGTTVGRVMSMGLARGLMTVGRTLLWVGRAMVMTPLGLVLTGIAVAGYLIYRNWDRIGPVFTKFVNIARDKLNALWSSMKALPERFMSIGREIVEGLLNGLNARFGAAKAAVVGFAGSMKSWFASVLGIHSPSRVFMGYGDNIAQGAALGIRRSTELPSRAAASMATQAAAAASMKRIDAARAGTPLAGRHAAGAGAANGVSIHFAPNITVQGGVGASVGEQVGRALNLSLRELEKMMERVVAQRARRAYGG
ncbi:phage tail tape measure protein [Burkholderia mayonis]|uniref:Phage tail tape measure protein n=1 Tax=Burkholderia mayonis TaxID=1385591 RepID=A0A1B4FRT0_9BURK|nr:phage tail tape measure protein [Burkholderia mayonis]AOJ06385.1 phage tail tape measure protein [Burkholderia mayonis]KVE51670.1 phage tail tape measure protein [Burkholderia mayonis]